MNSALDILMVSAFVVFPFLAFCWVWFCKLSPQRLLVTMLVTVAMNLVFGFALMPAMTKPTQGFQWAALLTSCVPFVWAVALAIRSRNFDERVSGWLGIAGLIWPVMVIGYVY